MCVIYYAKTKDARPPLSELRAGAARNKDGAGYAYFGPGGMPRWKRGVKLSPEEIFEDLKSIEGPVMIHFRLASSGGVMDELCHPYTMDWTPSLDPEGESSTGLIMQNGTWSQWKTSILDAVKYGGGKLQFSHHGHPWNDGRAIAALAGVYGPGWLDFKDYGLSKLGVVIPRGMYVLGSGWEKTKGGWLQSSDTTAYYSKDDEEDDFMGVGAASEKAKTIHLLPAPPDERSKRQKEVDAKMKILQPLSGVSVKNGNVIVEKLAIPVLPVDAYSEAMLQGALHMLDECKVPVLQEVMN